VYRGSGGLVSKVSGFVRLLGEHVLPAQEGEGGGSRSGGAAFCQRDRDSVRDTDSVRVKRLSGSEADSDSFFFL
jgi:hypothetical protein